MVVEDILKSLPSQVFRTYVLLIYNLPEKKGFVNSFIVWYDEGNILP